jgi:hypothetical protein
MASAKKVIMPLIEELAIHFITEFLAHQQIREEELKPNTLREKVQKLLDKAGDEEALVQSTKAALQKC